MVQLFVALQTLFAGKDEDKGATAVEYGLMVGLIAVVIIGAVTTLGTDISALFTRVSGFITPVAG